MTTARFGSITAIVAGALLLTSGVTVSLLSLGSPLASNTESAIVHGAGAIRDGESVQLSAGTRVVIQAAASISSGSAWVCSGWRCSSAASSG